MIDRIPPNDLAIEKALLGLALINNKLFQPQITEESFYSTAHQMIYRAIASLLVAGTPADISTVSSWLGDNNLLTKSGGAATIADLTNHAFNPEGIDHYAQIIQDHAARRKIISETMTTAQKAYEKCSIDELCSDLHNIANSLAPKSHRLRGIREISQSVVSELEVLSQKKEIPGISTGFPKIDKYMRLMPGEMTIIAGRPGMGKSSFALDITRAALFEGETVLWSSLEMTSERLTKRLLAAMSGINGQKFNDAKFEDSDWGKLMGALGKLSKTNLYIDDTPQVSSAHVRKEAHRVASKAGSIGVIIIDYVQLLREPGFHANNKRLEIGEISHNMVALAKELQTHVVLLSQLGRTVDDRKPPAPRISDLKESGDLEQDADNIMLLYRPEYYLKEDTPFEQVGIAEVILGKCRSGETGLIKVHWNGPTTSFKPLEWRY